MLKRVFFMAASLGHWRLQEEQSNFPLHTCYVQKKMLTSLWYETLDNQLEINYFPSLTLTVIPSGLQWTWHRWQRSPVEGLLPSASSTKILDCAKSSITKSVWFGHGFNQTHGGPGSTVASLNKHNSEVWLCFRWRTSLCTAIKKQTCWQRETSSSSAWAEGGKIPIGEKGLEVKERRRREEVEYSGYFWVSDRQSVTLLSFLVFSF